MLMLEQEEEGVGMKYMGKYRFVGTDGSMGLHRGAVYMLEVEKNAVIVYSTADSYRTPLTKVPYTVEGFVTNWRSVSTGEQR